MTWSGARDTAPSCLRLHKAGTPLARLRGLHGMPPLHDGVGLWLVPCRAIHTFWMDDDIDVVFLDRHLRVLRVLNRLAPRRVAWSWRAHSVVELMGGYCLRHPDHVRMVTGAVRRLRFPGAHSPRRR